MMDKITGAADGSDADDRAVVEREQSEVRDFVAGLSPDDIRSGEWFTRLLRTSLKNYAEKVDWKYFQDRYKGVPPDAIVDQRMKMAARYAAVEGGLSAGAYTAAVAATIGSLGGASPATVPAAVTTMMVDLVYVTRLQLRLAYDIAVLYGVPMDPSDPEDALKLIKVAFTIKGGEAAREGVVKVVPALVRPLVKRFYSRSVLAAGRGLPVIGRFLLQRNVIKVGIPVVGVPLAALVNRYSTLVAGRHARAVFRNEARVVEVARMLTDRSEHAELLLWVAWLVIKADEMVSDDEALLIRRMIRLADERHGVVDEKLARLVEVDPDDVWRRIQAAGDGLESVVQAAARVAEIDGRINSSERKLLMELASRCGVSTAPWPCPT